MLLPIKYSFRAFINHLGTYGILTLVQFWREVFVLFRHYQNCLVVLHLLRLVRLVNCLLDVGPHVRRVVSVQIDELLEHQVFELDVLRKWHEILLRKIFLATRFGDLIKIRLICILPDYVDGRIYVDAMLIAVLLRLGRQYVVVGDLREVKFDFRVPLWPLERVYSRRIDHLLRYIFEHWPLLFQHAV